ncbi:MAG: cyclase family protein [Acetobacteraceae bacterium]|nr:cyclase family protein [Acetobacteraceae bacterium]
MHSICGGMHVGTYMDAPLHMIEDGARISDIPVGKFFGRGRLVDARGQAQVIPDLLTNNTPKTFHKKTRIGPRRP